MVNAIDVTVSPAPASHSTSRLPADVLFQSPFPPPQPQGPHGQPGSSSCLTIAWSINHQPINHQLPPRSASGDHSAVEPPVPIPNTEVKRRSANGSRTTGPARVGRCQINSPFPSLGTGCPRLLGNILCMSRWSWCALRIEFSLICYHASQIKTVAMNTEEATLLVVPSAGHGGEDQ